MKHTAFIRLEQAEHGQMHEDDDDDDDKINTTSHQVPHPYKAQ
jgi:hypothetical protein